MGLNNKGLNESAALKTGEALNQMDETAVKSKEAIKASPETSKNQIIERARLTLAAYKNIQAKGQSKLSNFSSWSASYLSDKYPLCTQTILMYTMLSNAIDKYVETEEC